MQIDDDPPLALRRGDLDVLGVVRAAAAVRPGRPPLWRAGDRERHRRSEHGARAGIGRLATGPSRRGGLGALLDDARVEAPVELRERRHRRQRLARPARRARRAARDDDADRPWPHRLVAAGNVARDHSALGISHDSSVRTLTVKPVRRKAAVASLREAPSMSGTTARAVPRLTRRTRSRSARSTWA